MTKTDMPVWKSYVYHNDKCFFVSTIERDYDIPYAGGIVRGYETLVWEYDEETRKRGRIIWQGGSLQDHQHICSLFIRAGEVLDD